MPQLLKLIKKGDRFTPTVYQFGANERLNIHFEDQYADLTDAQTGAFIRSIGWQGLRDMGYSPAKLLDGDTSDQRSNSVSFGQHLLDCSKYLLAGFAVAALIALAGLPTGCTNFVLDQAEQDIATSTIEPRSNALTGDELLEFRRQSAHASKVLFLARTDGGNGDE